MLIWVDLMEGIYNAVINQDLVCKPPVSYDGTTHQGLKEGIKDNSYSHGLFPRNVWSSEFPEISQQMQDLAATQSWQLSSSLSLTPWGGKETCSNQSEPAANEVPSRRKPDGQDSLISFALGDSRG